jgi:hypothetical protein
MLVINVVSNARSCCTTLLLVFLDFSFALAKWSCEQLQTRKVMQATTLCLCY